MAEKLNKYLHWTPRILSIIFVVFLALLSLDIFSLGLGFWETFVGLFMHNIPTLILAAVVIISWKHEIVGGIGFILAGIAYLVMLFMNVVTNKFEWYMIGWFLIVAGPMFLTGILFLVNWYKKKGKE